MKGFVVYYVVLLLLACHSPAVNTEPADADRTKNNDTHNVYRDSSRLKKTDTIYQRDTNPEKKKH